MAVNFPDSPSDNQVFQTGGRSYKYNATLGGWKIVSSATSATDISDLTDTTNLLTGFDGDYTNLTNKPTIPADVSDLTDSTSLLGSSGSVFRNSGGNGAVRVVWGSNRTFPSTNVGYADSTDGETTV